MGLRPVMIILDQKWNIKKLGNMSCIQHEGGYKDILDAGVFLSLRVSYILT